MKRIEIEFPSDDLTRDDLRKLMLFVEESTYQMRATKPETNIASPTDEDRLRTVKPVTVITENLKLLAKLQRLYDTRMK